MERKQEEGQSCLFCLEPTQESKPNKLQCSCRFCVHSRCWSEYEQKKKACECPICHSVFITNPITILVTLPQQQEQQQSSQRNMEYPLDTVTSLCMCCLLGFIIAMIILNKLYG
jgi:hypothetical protein